MCSHLCALTLPFRPSRVAGVTRVSRLGFGEPLAISASHGDGMADLATALVPHYEGWEKEQKKVGMEREAGSKGNIHLDVCQ